jgi:hypothetical protein
MPDRKKPPLLKQNGVDLETWLCKQVAPAGTVEGVYGGFEIVVIDENAFPWANVLRRLVQSGHQVWLEERKGKLVIMTQPSID